MALCVQIQTLDIDLMLLQILENMKHLEDFAPLFFLSAANFIIYGQLSGRHYNGLGWIKRRIMVHNVWFKNYWKAN